MFLSALNLCAKVVNIWYFSDVMFLLQACFGHVCVMLNSDWPRGSLGSLQSEAMAINFVVEGSS